MEAVEETQPNAEVQQTEIETGPADEVTEETTNGLPSDTEEFVMPDKFQGKSAEDIARAYTELEKFKGNTPTEPEDEAEEPNPESEGNKYLDEFNKTGELSEESYEELLKQGVAKEDIDERLEYEKYKVQKRVDEVVDVVGGLEEYQAIEEWAADAYSEEDRASFVSEFQGASDFAKKAMLRDLQSQYKATLEGGDQIHTNEPQGVKGGGYTSQHDLQKDMADRRYGNDRSYTQAVEAKLAKTKGDW